MNNKDYYKKYIKYKNKYLLAKQMKENKGGSSIMDIKQYHPKDSICDDSSFDKKELLNEIINNDLLSELNLIIQSGPNRLEEYNTAYRNLISLIKGILGRVSRDNDKLTISSSPLSLVSYFKKRNTLPPKIKDKIKEGEISKVSTSITNYFEVILNIVGIEKLMCSTLYDKYMTSTRLDNKDARIFRIIMKDTIQRFDSDEDIIENFNLFHSKFAETFSELMKWLNTNYLTLPDNRNYLTFAKVNTTDGTKIINMIDIDETNLKILNDILDSFINDELKSKINTKNSSLLKDIESLKIKLKENDEKIDAFIKRNNESEFTSRFYDSDLEYYKSKENKLLKEIKDKELKIEKNNKKLNYNQFFISENDSKIYIEQIEASIKNGKNILVPITLIDLTKKETIKSIKLHILEKDNLTVKLKSHSNMLFINIEKQFIEHFEPHGVSGVYDSTEVFEVIEDIHKKIPVLSEYKYSKQIESCPYIYGPQALDGTAYCYIHSGYYSILRILYPDVTSEEIQTMLISKKNKTFKEEGMNKSSMDYLNKKYTALTGPEIKSRLENFMKWHRWIFDFMNSPNKKIFDTFKNIMTQLVPPLKFD